MHWQPVSDALDGNSWFSRKNHKQLRLFRHHFTKSLLFMFIVKQQNFWKARYFLYTEYSSYFLLFKKKRKKWLHINLQKAQQNINLAHKAENKNKPSLNHHKNTVRKMPWKKNRSTLPNNVCFLSKSGVAANVKKNCDPFNPSSLVAVPIKPRRLNFKRWWYSF